MMMEAARVMVKICRMSLGRLAVALLFVATPLAAQEDDAAGDGAPPGLFDRVGGFVDDTQRSASEQFTGFVESVDGFFGDGNDSTISNNSWARIRLEADKPGDEDLDLAASLKLRIVLPQSEQRFRLLFSSEDDEENSAVSAAGAARAPDIARESADSASLAIRFVRTARETSSVKFDVGIRQRDGDIQIFGRINTTAEGEMVRRWSGRVSNNYYYYSSSGFENKLRFSVKRPFKSRYNLLFQTSLGFDWRKGRKGAGIGSTTGLYADVSKRTAIALESLSGYATSLNGDDSARYRGTEIRIRFRQNVWRPWLYYEIWPSMSWPSSNDYERVYGGFLRLEMIIGQR